MERKTILTPFKANNKRQYSKLDSLLHWPLTKDICRSHEYPTNTKEATSARILMKPTFVESIILLELQTF